MSFHEEKKPVYTETYECDFCDKTFSRPDNVTRHIKAVHEGKKPFPCEECDKSFAEKRSLNHHMLSFHQGLYNTGWFKKQFLPCWLEPR